MSFKGLIKGTPIFGHHFRQQIKIRYASRAAFTTLRRFIAVSLFFRSLLAEFCLAERKQKAARHQINCYRGQ
jgi:hypothetical protein